MSTSATSRTWPTKAGANSSAVNPQAARDILSRPTGSGAGRLVEFAEREFAAGLATRLRNGVSRPSKTASWPISHWTATPLVGELAELVGRYPLREALRAELALALYRSGRQADALRAIEDARRTLLDELGVDPGRELREIESAILDHDPALDAPVVAIPAPRPARGPSRGRRNAAELFGRAREFGELVAALDEATRATCLVVVEGEPGIGKTRLVEEAAAIATERGALALWGRAFEGGAAPASGPRPPPLRTLAASTPESAIAPSSSPSSRPPPAAPGSSPSPHSSRSWTTRSTCCALHAARQPIMLILDDLQWADVASLELLGLVAGRVTDLPLLDRRHRGELEVGRNDAVVETLATMTRLPATRRLRLLGIDATARLHSLPRQPDRTATPASRTIHERGAARSSPPSSRWLLASTNRTGPADVPSGVRDVVRRRIALFQTRPGEILQVAAVIGRDVDFTLLAAASGIQLDVRLDVLDPAVVNRLLVAAPDQPGMFRFSHAVVREVVVDDIRPCGGAPAPEGRGLLGEDDATAEILAEHLWEAAPIGASEVRPTRSNAAAVASRRLAYVSGEPAPRTRSAPAPLARHNAGDQEAELRTVAQLVSVTAARAGYASVPAGSPVLERGKLVEAVGRVDQRLHSLWENGPASTSHASTCRPTGSRRRCSRSRRSRQRDRPCAGAHRVRHQPVAPQRARRVVASPRPRLVGAAGVEKDETNIPIFDLTQARLASASPRTCTTSSATSVIPTGATRKRSTSCR